MLVCGGDREKVEDAREMLVKRLLIDLLRTFA